MCDHWKSSVLTTKKPTVFKEECMYCFRTWDVPNWIEVCIGCFQGYCPEHFAIHRLRTDHCCSVRASRRAITDEQEESNEGNESPSKERRVEIKHKVIAYDHTFFPYCHCCQLQLNIPDNDPHVTIIKDSVEASRVAIAAAWSEQVHSCKHVECLWQEPVAAGLKQQCSQCRLSEHLWMCLTCGETGCGRKQFDGSGGNGHAREHYDSSGHSCSVKLGTIKNAAPDVHCYACDEMVRDDLIEEHLSQLLVDVSSVGAEKGMAELQYEQNAQWDWSMTTDDGQAFPSASASHPGIVNLGNSCYINSVMQPMIRLGLMVHEHDLANCDKTDPSSCLHCQLQKLSNALREQSDAESRIRPWMFKRVVSNGHAELSSGRQQDAAEFLVHLLKQLKLYSPFEFDLQQTLRCPECSHCSYSQTRSDLLQCDLADIIESSDAVNIESVLASFFDDEAVEAQCPKCPSSVQIKHFRLIDGPKECLVIVFGRSRFVNGSPVKVDRPVMLHSNLDLTRWMELPHEYAPNPAALSELLSMGFPEAAIVHALKASNDTMEEALNMLLSGSVPQSTTLSVKQEDVDALLTFGFDEQVVRAALMKANGSREMACELILSDPKSLYDYSVTGQSIQSSHANDKLHYRLSAFVSHKGPSLHCGHYIAHVWDAEGKRWVLYNDDKTAFVTTGGDALPDTSLAYIAFYLRS